MNSLLLLALSVVFLAHSAAAQQENFLIIVADDVGTDRIGSYNEYQALSVPEPFTPKIDSLLKEQGVLFRNAWSNPMCSPTRALLVTGDHAFRTGMGHLAMNQSNSWSLPVAEITIPETLPPAYSSVAVGKWHLGNDVTTHPMDSGFGEHHGSLHNLGRPIQNPNPSPPQTEVSSMKGDYFTWVRHDGNATSSTKTITSVFDEPFNLTSRNFVNGDNYATRHTANEAIEFVDGDGTGDLPEPWLLYVAFNAPHFPFHVPPPQVYVGPDDLQTTLSPNPTDGELHRIMIEAMDVETGRIIEAIDPAVLAHTTIIFLGDNGNPVKTVEGNQDPSHAKGSLYEGGINVPLIVRSPRLQDYALNRNMESSALVSLADVFQTVAEIAGVTTTAGEDSVSMVPLLEDPTLPDDHTHSFLYAERFEENGIPAGNASAIADIRNQGPTDPHYQSKYERTIRDEDYKLIRRNGTYEEFYDLQVAAVDVEATNLIPDGDTSSLSSAQWLAFHDLKREMEELVGLRIRCPGDPLDPNDHYGNDIDGDGICDATDSCIQVADPQEVDTDADGCGNPCDADYNNDGTVNAPDFFTFVQALGTANPDVDHNLDGTVGGPDFFALRALFQKPPGPSGHCP